MLKYSYLVMLFQVFNNINYKKNSNLIILFIINKNYNLFIINKSL